MLMVVCLVCGLVAALPARSAAVLQPAKDQSAAGPTTCPGPGSLLSLQLDCPPPQPANPADLTCRQISRHVVVMRPNLRRPSYQRL
jgi:hypothetical protein